MTPRDKNLILTLITCKVRAQALYFAVNCVFSLCSAIQSLWFIKNLGSENLGTKIKLFGNLVFDGMLNCCIVTSQWSRVLDSVVGSEWE